MRHFLLIYDHDERRLIDQRDFDGSMADEATAAYREAEREHGRASSIEIVLVGADSIETIHRTHGHYFGATSPVDKYLTPA